MTQIELIYAKYPRKANRRAALEAIRRACERDGSAMVMAGTLAFASSRAAVRPEAGPDPRPYPATFYDQRRYLDDPAEWECERSED